MESLPSQSECSNKFKLSYVTFLTANFAWHTGIDAHNIICLLKCIDCSYYWVQDNKRYVAKLDGCIKITWRQIVFCFYNRHQEQRCAATFPHFQNKF